MKNAKDKGCGMSKPLALTAQVALDLQLTKNHTTETCKFKKTKGFFQSYVEEAWGQVDVAGEGL